MAHQSCSCAVLILFNQPVEPLLSSSIIRSRMTNFCGLPVIVCPAPYIRPLIFGFSNKVSGTGGRMFNAW